MNTSLPQKATYINWSIIVLFSLGFWLSSSLLLDAVILPSLAAAGMMNTGLFASAGYVIFGIFNHIELLCAATVLTGFLVFYHSGYLTNKSAFWMLLLAGSLLLVTGIDTYWLTPQMSSLAMPLNLFDSFQPMTNTLMRMHGGYWALETVKFLAGLTLLRWCYRHSFKF